MSGSLRRVIFAAMMGTIVEQYDFFIYNTAAALVFNKLFFPQVSPIIGVMLAFGTSATGFAARPIGAIVSGHFGDRVGRKALLLATILLMGLATFAIGLLPTYSSIGIAAPILLLTLRIIQGFAVGGEFGGAALMIRESTPPGQRGFLGSLITVGIMVGLIGATLIFARVSALPGEALLDWGWRIPFLGSAVLVAVGFYVRLRVSETPEFLRMLETGRRARAPLIEALRQPKQVIIIFFMRVAENSYFYVASGLAIAYVVTSLGMPRSVALSASLIASVAEALSVMFFGWLADHIGFRKIMLAGLAFQVLYAFPFFWLLDTKDPVLITIALVIAFAVCNGSISAVQPGWLPGFFTVNSRASGLALGRELASVIGGGLAPVIATGLIATMHAAWPVAAMLAVASSLGFIAAWYVGRLGVPEPNEMPLPAPEFVSTSP